MVRRLLSIAFVTAVCLLVGVALIAQRHARPAPREAASPMRPPVILPLLFETVEPGDAMSARSRGYSVRVQAAGATFTAGNAAIMLRFAGGGGTLHAERPQRTTINYYRGQASEWRSGIHPFGAARIANVYRGIDALFYGNDRAVEYDLVVAPHARADQIRLRFDGVDDISLDDGGVRLRSGKTTLIQHAPFAYQTLGGRRVPVRARYVLDKDKSVRVEVGAYDTGAPLVIDPTVTYATYFGMTGTDIIRAIAADAAGNVYLAGQTTNDGYVAKLDRGGALLWLSIIGGGESDGAWAVAAAPRGNVFVTGWTWSSDFPTTPGAYSAASPRTCDAYVSALAPDGRLVASTTLAAPQPWGVGCGATGLAIDAQGRPNVVGSTASPWFVPTRADSFGRRRPDLDQPDGFFARFSADLSRIEVSRLIAGSGYDYPNAAAIDQYGNLYVVGRTTSSDFPILNAYRSQKYEPGDPEGEYGYDGFMTMIWDNGTIGYSTYIGGSREDSVNAVAIGQYDRPYIGGGTESAETWFYKPSPVGQSSGFVFEMVPNSTGVLGGYMVDAKGFTGVNALAVGSDLAIWVAGTTDGIGFQQNAPDDPKPQPGPGGSADMFVQKLESHLAGLYYSYLLGGAGSDEATAIALDDLGDIYVGGSSTGGYPVLNARQPEKNEPATTTRDGVLTKLGCHISTFLPVDQQPASGGPGTASIYALDGCGVRAESTASWLHVTGADRSHVYFTTDANTATSSRTGEIVVSGKKIMPVVQAAGTGGGGTPSADEIVLGANNLTRAYGEWQVIPDAVHGSILSQPDRGAPKLSTPSTNPANWFEFTFTADAGRPYHLWVHGRAQHDSWQNDSIYAQFSDSVDANGNPVYRIGTTTATWVSLEECSGCGEQGWGWQDNGYGTRGDLGPDIYFATSGTHTVQFQTREDGFDIGQVVLSARTYLRTAPGGNTNDRTIVGGGTPTPPPAIDEIVLWAAYGATSTQYPWQTRNDSTAAGQVSMWNPNLGAPKTTAPEAFPSHAVDIPFEAEAGKAYHLWLRMKADDDAWTNDSVWVQFSGSVDASGNPLYRMGTTSGTWVSLEECSGCGEQGWGWQDNAYGAPGNLGDPIYFATSGPQTLRLQIREDGLAIDQIVLSAVKYKTSAPGAARNDNTVVPRTDRP